MFLWKVGYKLEPQGCKVAWLRAGFDEADGRVLGNAGQDAVTRHGTWIDMACERGDCG